MQEFRQAIYKNLCQAQDATFELMDALLLTRTAQSLADLWLSIAFRRQWSSVYEALQDTRPDREQLTLFCHSRGSISSDTPQKHCQSYGRASSTSTHSQIYR